MGSSMIFSFGAHGISSDVRNDKTKNTHPFLPPSQNPSETCEKDMLTNSELKQYFLVRFIFVQEKSTGNRSQNRRVGPLLPENPSVGAHVGLAHNLYTRANLFCRPSLKSVVLLLSPRSSRGTVLSKMSTHLVFLMIFPQNISNRSKKSWENGARRQFPETFPKMCDISNKFTIIES